MCPYCLTYWRITAEINYVPLLFDLLTYYYWNQLCALIVWLTDVLLLKSIMCPYCLTYWRITTEINDVPLLFDLLTYYYWNQLCALIVWLTDVVPLKSIMCPYCLTCYKFLSYDFHIKMIFGSSLPPVVGRRAYVLLWVFFVCVCLRIVLSNTYCVACSICLRLVSFVSLGCPFDFL
jgi:uncharacterized Zn-finger protein